MKQTGECMMTIVTDFVAKNIPELHESASIALYAGLGNEFVNAIAICNNNLRRVAMERFMAELDRKLTSPD